MNIAIFCSNKDVAGVNIRDRLLELKDWKYFAIIDGNRCYELETKNHTVRLYTVDKDLIYYNNLDELIVADQYVFATRHSSGKGVKALTVHSAGNFGKAEFGGYDSTLSISNASLIKNCYNELLKIANDYEIAQEATHHGPVLKKPLMFIELGSNLEGWQNKEGAKLVARALLSALDLPLVSKSAFGIGGPHYSPNFKALQINSDYALGHVCAKYNLKDLSEEKIIDAIEKTVPKCNLIVLDYKGLGSEKQRILSVLDKINIKVAKSSEF